MNVPVAIPRPRRWDRPFGEMTGSDVDRVLLTLTPFGAIDPEQFPSTLALQDIIRNDARIRRFEPGDIIVRRGDYGNSVFLVMRGQALEIQEAGGEAAPWARRRVRKRGVLGSLSQLWRNARVPERRDVSLYQSQQARLVRRGRGRAVSDDGIEDLAELVEQYPTHRLAEQAMFGEVAALSRTSHVATVVAETEVELLELRWQGLRDIRRRDKQFRAQIDALYCATSLKTHLRESPLFRGLPDEALDHIAGQTLFETYGEFEWAGEFKEIALQDPDEVLLSEPVIAEHGDYLDGLLLIRSGFGRISERLDHGHRTVGYITRNEVFGLQEIVDQWRLGSDLRLRYGLRAVGFVDLLRVPTALIEDYVLPNLPEEMIPAPSGEGARAEVHREPWDTELELTQPTINFLMNNRTINGTAAMFINTDRCTGCDDCVRACAIAHDNNPRFVRHGPEHDNFMVTNACMHCVDAVCLIGCPTGAIHRNIDGPVIIDDTVCIGCATCAESCPYNNIRMVEIRDAKGSFIVDQDTKAPIVKATKCDLCLDQIGGPACARACPHDALVRLDMRERDALVDWLSR